MEKKKSQNLCLPLQKTFRDSSNIFRSRKYKSNILLQVVQAAAFPLCVQIQTPYDLWMKAPLSITSIHAYNTDEEIEVMRKKQQPKKSKTAREMTAFPTKAVLTYLAVDVQTTIVLFNKGSTCRTWFHITCRSDNNQQRWTWFAIVSR